MTTKAASQVCLSAALALGFPLQALAEMTLTYATYIPNAYAVTEADDYFMTEVEKRSNGEIKFEKYWAGSLVASPPELLRAIGGGAAHIGGSSVGSYNKNELPLHQMILPFQSVNMPAVTHTMNEMYQENADVRAEFERQGVVAIYFRAYPENTIWTMEPLNTIDDLKGKKFRAVNLIADAIEDLGGTPVAIPWTEATEGLSRGVVDGMTGVPFDSAVPTGLHEIAKYATEAAGMGIYGTWTLAMNKDTYDSLSPELQKIIHEVAADTMEMSLAAGQAINEANAKTMCETEGLTVTAFSEEEAQKAREMSAGAIEAEFVTWATEKSGVDAKAVLDQYVTRLRENEQKYDYTPGMVAYNNLCGSK